MGVAATAAGVALVAGGCEVPCACAENPMNTPSIPTPIVFFHANFMLETFLREHFAVTELEARRTHFVGWNCWSRKYDSIARYKPSEFCYAAGDENITLSWPERLQI